MAPEQIETMKRIQCTGAVDYALLRLLPGWAWRVTGPSKQGLTEAGAEVLRLWEALTAERAAHAETVRQGLVTMGELEEGRLALAAEQGRQEGAPSVRWVFAKHRTVGWCWVLPYDDQELPAERHGQPWSGLDTDHDPKCIVFPNRRDGGWSLSWRLERLPISDHPSARAAMLAADKAVP